MKLAVQFYKDLPNPPKAIPTEWPAACMELADDAQVPEGWTEMSVESYNAIRDELSRKYNAYIQGHDPLGRWRTGKLPHHYIKRAWRKAIGTF